jgi:hypothetical protein
MKIKSIVAMVGLLVVALFSSAFTSSKEDARKEEFLVFLSQFPKVDLPFSLGIADMEGYRAYRQGKAQSVAQRIERRVLRPSRFLPGSEASKFSRMGPPEMRPIARFYPNEKMVAVVYAASSPFSDDLYVDYVLAVYDLKGNILPVKQGKTKASWGFPLASSGGEYSVTCSIDSRGHITQTQHLNKWKKDVGVHGYAGNQLVGFEAQKSTHFKIDEKGNITESKMGNAVAFRP